MPRRAAVWLAAAALALAGCSGGDSGGDSASSASSAAGSSSSAAASSSSDGGGTYLALGDSVPFGYRGGGEQPTARSRRLRGYPEPVGDKLGLEVVNPQLPG